MGTWKKAKLKEFMLPLIFLAGCMPSQETMIEIGSPELKIIEPKESANIRRGEAFQCVGTARFPGEEKVPISIFIEIKKNGTTFVSKNATIRNLDDRSIRYSIDKVALPEPGIYTVQSLGLVSKGTPTNEITEIKLYSKSVKLIQH